jgi:CRP/FNR family transcriptional regulator, cyclic AMP receptor protein
MRDHDTSGQDAERVLTTHGWLSEQPPALQRAILDDGHVQRYPRGATVVRPGEPPPGLFAVVDGMVKLHHDLPDGREVVLWPAEPGFWFGVRDLIADERFRYAATAAIPTTLFHLPKPAFAAILAKEPRYAINFANIMARNFLLALHQLAEILSEPVVARVAYLLALLCQQAGELGGDWHILKLPQQDLASMVKLPPETVTKALQVLEADDLIELQFDHIVVTNFIGLAQYPH